ncbi:SIR2 family protein [Phaeobacter inhibens]|uniref:SIR2 family NAD-dependent protein deacylase n=1 Tax=Phaeobacter inhibens TaxID=221822 RepID=UPI0021A4B429|nr:SIR2 family protein [Phaeobacter inhibens]UWR84930.1 SIR2 family protein [Phaeobacter inhibens]
MREYFEAEILDQIDAASEVDVVGKSWPGSEIYKMMEEKGLDEHIETEIARRKAEAKDRTRRILTETECLERFQLLLELTQKGMVLPFVGAGMSSPSGFKLWNQLLLDLTADSPALRVRVRSLLAQYLYEEAAQEICDTLGDAALNQDVRAHLGREAYDVRGAVRLLPYCFGQGCLTTNLDNVLERVYTAAGLPVGDPVFGAHLKEQRGFVNPDERRLYKLHGTALVPDGRVLTRREYDQTYANDITLSRVLDHIIGARHLLFMGCSLGVDRTLKELTTLFADAPNNYPEHYAFLPLYEDTNREKRRKEMGAANISPIWYPASEEVDHNQHMEDFLLCLIDGSLDE